MSSFLDEIFLNGCTKKVPNGIAGECWWGKLLLFFAKTSKKWAFLTVFRDFQDISRCGGACDGLPPLSSTSKVFHTIPNKLLKSSLKNINTQLPKNGLKNSHSERRFLKNRLYLPMGEKLGIGKVKFGFCGKFWVGRVVPADFQTSGVPFLISFPILALHKPKIWKKSKKFLLPGRREVRSWNFLWN